MFLRSKFREEQAEAGGDGGGGTSEPPDMKEEFTAILDTMEAEDAAEEAAEAQVEEPVAAAEEPSSDDDSVTPDEQPESTVSDDDNWLTDDLRERAANYHFSEEMMLAQGSPEEVEANMLLIDNYQQRQLELQQRAWEADNPAAPPIEPIDPAAPAAEGQSPPAGGAPPPPQPPPGFQFRDFSAEIENLVTEGYDAPLTDLQRGMAEQQKQMLDYIQAQEQRLMQVENHAMQVQQGAVQNHQNRVLTMIDNLGREDLFGTANEYSPEQASNADRVNAQLEFMVQREGYKLNPATVKQAYQRVFSQDLLKDAVTNKFNKVQGQSRKRMGRGPTATPRADLEWDGDQTEDPVLLAAGRKMMREANGY